MGLMGHIMTCKLLTNRLSTVSFPHHLHPLLLHHPHSECVIIKYLADSIYRPHVTSVFDIHHAGISSCTVPFLPGLNFGWSGSIKVIIKSQSEFQGSKESIYWVLHWVVQWNPILDRVGKIIDQCC